MLEGMLFDFLFVDLDSQPGPSIGSDDSAVLFDDESLSHDVLPPGDVEVYGFADDVGLAAQLNASDCAPVLVDGAFVAYGSRV